MLKMQDVQKYVPDTECRNPISADIDVIETVEMLSIINEEDKKIALAVENELSHIANTVEVAERTIRGGGRVVYMGCGTSGRLGVLDASECPPTYNVAEDWFMGIIAGGRDALVKSSEGAEDSAELGVNDLKAINFSKKDMLIGIAASGRTPYVIGGIKYAGSLGASTACVVCSKNSPIAKTTLDTSGIAISVDTGAEVITGSTRMKAGTGTKMVLNMISTGTMVRLGKVYGNLMVDLKPANSKLVIRAQNIICEITNCTEEEAADFLTKANNNVKAAIVMIKEGIDLHTAEKRLTENNGLLKKCIRNRQEIT